MNYNQVTAFGTFFTVICSVTRGCIVVCFRVAQIGEHLVSKLNSRHDLIRIPHSKGNGPKDKRKPNDSPNMSLGSLETKLKGPQNHPFRSP